MIVLAAFISVRLFSSVLGEDSFALKYSLSLANAITKL